jgi:hypothetical protein
VLGSWRYILVQVGGRQSLTKRRTMVNARNGPAEMMALPSQAVMDDIVKLSRGPGDGMGLVLEKGMKKLGGGRSWLTGTSPNRWNNMCSSRWTLMYDQVSMTLARFSKGMSCLERRLTRDGLHLFLFG